MIEGISMAFVTTVITILGLPGAVLVLWYVDNRRYDRLEKKRDKEVAMMLASQKEETNKLLREYKDDLATVTRFYEDNVLLVKNYQRLADDLSGVITLNTQVQTQLVESIKNNMFCPIVREKGPQAA